MGQEVELRQAWVTIEGGVSHLDTPHKMPSLTGIAGFVECVMWGFLFPFRGLYYSIPPGQGRDRGPV